jgi:hypothetical protein
LAHHGWSLLRVALGWRRVHLLLLRRVTGGSHGLLHRRHSLHRHSLGSSRESCVSWLRSVTHLRRGLGISLRRWRKSWLGLGITGLRGIARLGSISHGRNCLLLRRHSTHLRRNSGLSLGVSRLRLHLLLRRILPWRRVRWLHVLFINY